MLIALISLIALTAIQYFGSAATGKMICASSEIQTAGEDNVVNDC